MREEKPAFLASLPGPWQVADAGVHSFFPAACPRCPHKKSPEFRPQAGGFFENGATTVEFWARTQDSALRTQVKPKGLASGSSLPSPLNFPVFLFLASETSHPYPPASSRSSDSQLPMGSQEQHAACSASCKADTGPFLEHQGLPSTPLPSLSGWGQNEAEGGTQDLQSFPPLLCPLLAPVCPMEGSLGKRALPCLGGPFSSHALTLTSSSDRQDSSAITFTRHEQAWDLARYFLVATETTVDAQLGGGFPPSYLSACGRMNREGPRLALRP